jgi:hypothetical protein
MTSWSADELDRIGSAPVWEPSGWGLAAYLHVPGQPGRRHPGGDGEDRVVRGPPVDGSGQQLRADPAVGVGEGAAQQTAPRVVVAGVGDRLLPFASGDVRRAGVVEQRRVALLLQLRQQRPQS